ncbi:FkbM family methyltransferase [Chloroflexota bacterium]
MGDKGKVLSIEPEPTNFAALERNLQLNNLTNVCAFNVACWSSNQRLKLFLAPGGTTSHSVIETHEHYIMVEGRRLDDILRDLGWRDVNLIKIDAEEATPDVLAGAEETLSSNEQLQIIFEAHATELERCREILERHGYTLRPMAPIFNNNFLATKIGQPDGSSYI